ncbi:PIN domain-containing protein [Rhizocola hellebori]|uniref:PIN domain-containing protein n=1 Tax=Rhizocola hellebori TaxID=1392758 RepID=UPI00194587A6
MTVVVDTSIVIRLLANNRGDELLRQRLARRVHAPALIYAEVSSVVRGLSVTTKPNKRTTDERAHQMLADYAGLRSGHPALSVVAHRRPLTGVGRVGSTDGCAAREHAVNDHWLAA